MSQDLTLYRHLQPKLFYTDNMINKDMLESIFTLLLDNVTPVKKYLHLLTFFLFHSCISQILNSVSEINNAICSILNDLPAPSELQSETKLVVVFNSECTVDISELEHILGHSLPAVLQIAYKEQVFILQVHKF